MVWTDWVSELWAIPTVAALFTRFNPTYILAALYIGCQGIQYQWGLYPENWLPLDIMALAGFLWLRHRNHDVLSGWLAMAITARIALHLYQLVSPLDFFWYITAANVLYGVLCGLIGARWLYLWRMYP